MLAHWLWYNTLSLRAAKLFLQIIWPPSVLFCSSLTFKCFCVFFSIAVHSPIAGINQSFHDFGGRCCTNTSAHWFLLGLWIWIFDDFVWYEAIAHIKCLHEHCNWSTEEIRDYFQDWVDLVWESWTNIPLTDSMFIILQYQ